MTEVAPGLYIDTLDGKLWRKTKHGKDTVLASVIPNGIASVLESLHRQSPGLIKSTTLRELEEASMPKYKPGDVVEWYDGDVRHVGSVKSANGETLMVSDNDSGAVVQLSAYEVIRRQTADEKNKLFEYYRQVYGDEYARKLVYPNGENK